MQLIVKPFDFKFVFNHYYKKMVFLYFLNYIQSANHCVNKYELKEKALLNTRLIGKPRENSVFLFQNHPQRYEKLICYLD